DAVHQRRHGNHVAGRAGLGRGRVRTGSGAGPHASNSRGVQDATGSRATIKAKRTLFCEHKKPLVPVATTAGSERSQPDQVNVASQQHVLRIERSIVQKSITTSWFITVSLLILLSVVAAQTRRPVPPPAINIASYLPASDGIAIVDAK